MITRAAAGLGAGALILSGLLSGCGGDDPDDEVDFADRSYAEIKESALDAMASLESLHVDASITSEGESAGLDLSMDAAGNCAGSVVFGEASAEVLRAGDGAWYKPSPGLLGQAFPGKVKAVTEFVGDAWVLDERSEVSGSNCDLEQLVDQLDDAEESKTEVAGVEKLDGQDVVRLDYTNDQGDGSAYVLADGEHYIVKIDIKGDEPGTALFSGFDEAVETEAPAEGDVVDLADFQA